MQNFLISADLYNIKIIIYLLVMLLMKSNYLS